MSQNTKKHLIDPKEGRKGKMEEQKVEGTNEKQVAR